MAEPETKTAVDVAEQAEPIDLVNLARDIREADFRLGQSQRYLTVSEQALKRLK